MEILTGFLDAVKGIFYSSGLVNLNWQNYAMIAISCVLLYLAIIFFNIFIRFLSNSIPNRIISN